ncbi:MAG: sigma-70 family RNA polymerase sigma factor [Candidatus Eisenbacteria bacterium]|nr:sigma-70 family RNA polymerase sigma factor [Candidatus Eisenbacteria bacterium]
MGSSPEERRLVARARAGEEGAFRSLLRRHQRDVFNLAFRILRNREDAEDAAQEVFLRIYRSLEQYDPERPFRNWLLRITHNLCIDWLRRRRIATVSLGEPLRQDEGEIEWELPDPSAADPLETLLGKEERELVEEAIAKLGPTLRSAIVLRHVQGLRYEEIADVLGIPLGTVKVRLFRARAAIAELLGRKLEREGR